jgi:hypothetical protein
VIVMGKQKIWVRTEKYDPLTGVFVRDMRVNDIVITTARSAAGGTGIATSTNGANTNLYPYALHVGVETGYAIISLMSGTTTLGIYFTGTSDDMINIISTPDAPLGKVAASSSLSVDVLATETAGATINVTVISNRVPINSKI